MEEFSLKRPLPDSVLSVISKLKVKDRRIAEFRWEAIREKEYKTLLEKINPLKEEQSVNAKLNDTAVAEKEKYQASLKNASGQKKKDLDKKIESCKIKIETSDKAYKRLEGRIEKFTKEAEKHAEIECLKSAKDLVKEVKEEADRKMAEEKEKRMKREREKLEAKEKLKEEEEKAKAYLEKVKKEQEKELIESKKLQEASLSLNDDIEITEEEKKEYEDFLSVESDSDARARKAELAENEESEEEEEENNKEDEEENEEEEEEENSGVDLFARAREIEEMEKKNEAENEKKREFERLKRDVHTILENHVGRYVPRPHFSTSTPEDRKAYENNLDFAVREFMNENENLMAKIFKEMNIKILEDKLQKIRNQESINPEILRKKRKRFEDELGITEYRDSNSKVVNPDLDINKPRPYPRNPFYSSSGEQASSSSSESPQREQNSTTSRSSKSENFGITSGPAKVHMTDRDEYLHGEVATDAEMIQRQKNFMKDIEEGNIQMTNYDNDGSRPLASIEELKAKPNVDNEFVENLCGVDLLDEEAPALDSPDWKKYIESRKEIVTEMKQKKKSERAIHVAITALAEEFKRKSDSREAYKTYDKMKKDSPRRVLSPPAAEAIIKLMDMTRDVVAFIGFFQVDKTPVTEDEQKRALYVYWLDTLLSMALRKISLIRTFVDQDEELRVHLTQAQIKELTKKELHIFTEFTLYMKVKYNAVNKNDNKKEQTPEQQEGSKQLIDKFNKAHKVFSRQKKRKKWPTTIFDPSNRREAKSTKKVRYELEFLESALYNNKEDRSYYEGYDNGNVSAWSIKMEECAEACGLQEVWNALVNERKAQREDGNESRNTLFYRIFHMDRFLLGSVLLGLLTAHDAAYASDLIQEISQMGIVTSEQKIAFIDELLEVIQNEPEHKILTSMLLKGGEETKNLNRPTFKFTKQSMFNALQVIAGSDITANRIPMGVRGVKFLVKLLETEIKQGAKFTPEQAKKDAIDGVQWPSENIFVLIVQGLDRWFGYYACLGDVYYMLGRGLKAPWIPPAHGWFPASYPAVTALRSVQKLFEGKIEKRMPVKEVKELGDKMIEILKMFTSKPKKEVMEILSATEGIELENEVHESFDRVAVSVNLHCAKNYMRTQEDTEMMGFIFTDSVDRYISEGSVAYKRSGYMSDPFTFVHGSEPK